MIYYISDTHFKDQKIFEKCKRPFKSVDEIKNVNGIGDKKYEELKNLISIE